jgi:hypothetical protein
MNNDIKVLSNMSITELKQLLSCVNQDIKSIKRRENVLKKINNEISEYDICNDYSAKFSKTVIIENITNKKIKQDIQIQTDILDYLNNGGHIICAKQRKSKYKF